MIWTKAVVQAVIRSGWIFKNEIDDMWLGNTETIGGGEDWRMTLNKKSVSKQNVLGCQGQGSFYLAVINIHL